MIVQGTEISEAGVLLHNQVWLSRFADETNDDRFRLDQLSVTITDRNK